jgi:CheY-like chemotaxis protein
MRILLADIDLSRGRRLSEACTARGHVVEQITHGAGALQHALESVPDVVVCPTDLPVIDAGRLAEILRGNPRTRSVSFVFLVKDELDAPLSMDPRDCFVVSPWREDDLLAHIDAILDRGHRPGAETRKDTELEGNLSQISAPDLIQVLQMNQRSGTLRLTRPSGGSGSISICDGEVIDAAVPLRDGAAISGEKALFRLLGWRDGRFQFVPGSMPESGPITRPNRALMIEATRQLDEWEKMKSEMPLSATRLRVVSTPDVQDQPLTQAVIEAVTLYTRVADVVDACDHPDYQVMKAISELITRGVLAPEESGDPDRQTSDGSSSGMFTPSQLRRIRDWATLRRPQLGSVLKLLVLSASPEALCGFMDALRGCPDFRLDARLSRSPGSLGDLGTLGSFDLGEGMSLRLLSVPAVDAYEPLLRVASSGMLGAIVLPSGPYGAALEATEAGFQTLVAQRPRGVVHLILDASSGNLSAGARDLVSNLEGGTVFVLPQGTERERVGVLRNLFARLVP